MARTQIKAQNILDHSLTGASFRTELRYYDETINYSSGAIVFWAGVEYQSNTNITGGDEGDLTNAPNISSDWKIYSKNLGQLQKLTEGSNTGYRLRDSEPNNFGDIGQDAIDLSISNTTSTEYGATGNYSLAIGYNNIASGEGSVAIGYGNRANFDYAFASGQNTISSGVGSHTEGVLSEAKWDYCHAEGYHCIAGTSSGGGSAHAEGIETIASGAASHSSGYNTIAGYDFQFVCGGWNENKSDTYFEIGGGTGSTNRNNLFEVYSDGTANLDSTVAEIDSRGNLAVINKQYFDSKKSSSTIDFDSTANQTDFIITGKVFDTCLLHINGILQRSNSYTIADNGTDTTITLDTPINSGVWVAVTI